MSTQMAKAMTEDQLLIAITEAADLYGWRWHHVRRSDRALQQGQPGFPDLILLRGTQLLALELKTERGRMHADQTAWLQAFSDVGARAWAIRPGLLDAVLRILAGDQAVPRARPRYDGEADDAWHAER